MVYNQFSPPYLLEHPMQSKKKGGHITIRLTEKQQCQKECEDKKPQNYITPDSTANLSLAWDRYFDCYKECNIQYPNTNPQQPSINIQQQRQNVRQQVSRENRQRQRPRVTMRQPVFNLESLRNGGRRAIRKKIKTRKNRRTNF